MASDKKIIFARVDQTTFDSIQSLADARFNGTISEVVREGAKLFVELRNALGPSFELEVHELLQRNKQEASAA